MSDVRPSLRARAGLLAVTALAVPLVAVDGAAAQVPTGECPASPAAHYEQVPDVIVGVVREIDEPAVDADTRQIALAEVRPLAGDVETADEMLVKAEGVPSGQQPKPAAGQRYVVYLSPTNDEGQAAAFGARLCDFLPESRQGEVVAAIDEVDARAEEPSATAVSWTDLDAGDGTDYGSAVLPGFLIAAIGAFGLAGTVLLSRVIGRRR